MLLFAIAALTPPDTKLPDWAAKVVMETEFSAMANVTGWGFRSRHTGPPNRNTAAIAVIIAATQGERALKSFEHGTPKPESDQLNDVWRSDPWIVSSWAKRIPVLVKITRLVSADVTLIGSYDKVTPESIVARLEKLEKPLAALRPATELAPSPRATEIVADLRKRGWLKGFPEFRPGPLLPNRQNYAAATAQAVREAYDRPSYSAAIAATLYELVQEFRFPLFTAGWLESPDHESGIGACLRLRGEGDKQFPTKYFRDLAKKPVPLKR